jgi:methylmalonyl-CoA mutase N-terminal domain/subunit
MSNEAQQPRSAMSLLIEDLLVGTVEAIARAGAKAVESLTDDAAKAVKREALKIEAVGGAVKAWRKANVGEIKDADIPVSLRDD